MTTICILTASLIFIAGLFAAIVERTGERDEARDELARVNREHDAEYAELDQENMRLHDALTHGQIAAGTVRIPSLHVVRDTEWPDIVRAVEGEL